MRRRRRGASTVSVVRCPHLVQLFSEFQALGVDIYLHQQAVDSSTPAGRALLQMSGVFAEFGKAMLQERVATGLARHARSPRAPRAQLTPQSFACATRAWE
jgi:DNA invertase Pin-like site-specific DNA recombinase